MTTTKIPIRQLGRIVAVGLLCFSPALIGCGKKADTTERDKLDNRLREFDAKGQIYSILIDFTRAVDENDAASLSSLGPNLDTNFTLDITDFLGADYHFDGLKGLVLGFGPMVIEAQAKVAATTFAIDVDLDNDSAKAYFTGLGSVKPPKDLGVADDIKVLVHVDNTASFSRGADGKWKLRSLKMVSSLAYPGSVELIGG